MDKDLDGLLALIDSRTRAGALKWLHTKTHGVMVASVGRAGTIVLGPYQSDQRDGDFVYLTIGNDSGGLAVHNVARADKLIMDLYKFVTRDQIRDSIIGSMTSILKEM